MKRSGYTLAEALIALAVVGIIAAVMLPLVSKYKPDTTKVLYLRTYDAISRTIAEFSSNVKMFPEWNGDKYEDDIRYFDYPFYNKGKVKLDNGKTVEEADNKICNLLALSAGAKEIKCENDYDTYTDGGFEPSYKYKNGVEVFVSTLRTNPDSENKAQYRTDIYFDVDGKDKGPNCLYNSISCKNPDTFKVFIGADGKVAAGDAYGYEYLKKRQTWKKQEMVIGVLPDFNDKLNIERYCDIAANKESSFCKCYKQNIAEDSKECICDVMGDTSNPICETQDPPPGGPDSEPDPCEGLTGLEYTCCVNPEDPACIVTPEPQYYWIGEVSFGASCEPAMTGSTIPFKNGYFDVELSDKLASKDDFDKLFDILDKKVVIDLATYPDCQAWIKDQSLHFETEDLQLVEVSQ